MSLSVLLCQPCTTLIEVHTQTHCSVYCMPALYSIHGGTHTPSVYCMPAVYNTQYDTHTPVCVLCASRVEHSRLYAHTITSMSSLLLFMIQLFT